MAKYRVPVSIDGENFFWIVVDNGRLINNPTKEDLIGTKVKSYNMTNICSKCREEKEKNDDELTDKNILYPKNSLFCEIDKNGKKIDEWICYRHYKRYSPNSYDNIRKSLTDRRTGSLKDRTKILGDNCEELTCKWRGLNNLNKENDNYLSPIDHSRDSELGIIQTKGRLLVKLDEKWNFGSFYIELEKEFNNMICYCISSDEKIIERIYIFPKKEIERVTGITIYKNPVNAHGTPIISRYEQYRVKDEKVLEEVNKIWNKIIIR